MDDEPITSRPPNPGEKILRDKFYEFIAAQDELMGKLAGQLLILELAVPGLYGTVLKFLRGKDATIQLNCWFYCTYAAWLLALALTLIALIPRNWKVKPNVLRQDPAKYNEGLGIEDFLRKSAEYKRRLLIAASILFFAGIFVAGATI